MTDSANNGEKKSKIPYIFFAFFAVVLAVNIFYIYLSKKTWHGLISENAYQKGLNYNQSLELAKKQKELGWKISINYNPINPNSGVFMVKLFDKNGNPINDANILLNIKRPSQSNLDFSQQLNFSEGFYQAQVEFPLRGQWEIEAVASRGLDIFQEVKRYVIQ
jgi:nitrogen fixation protein FixH